MSDDHGRANAMGVEELAAYLAEATLNPPIADLATLDGYLSALVVGPKFIHPQQFMPEVLGPKADLSLTAWTEALRAVQGIAAEYNRIATTLSDQPRAYAPRFGRTADGHTDPSPWCDGFGRAIRPRRRLWKRLLDTGRAEFRMIDPILAHASPATARALLGPKALDLSLPEAHPAPTIAAAVVTLRGYWMPDRAKASRNASR
ncbi:hypothetical protein CKO28_26440 [Rhodovibrio sodomensis]|uniref:YecA family protein n=1 Tax=Rhodovibrio sodomensis TaxID=1088 RepID=A0ABS1DNP8_9PROT|nr:UPF0149 family protein [Rhodovibrio sodomensis]MBK1671542.1 hypothetical protein [Rhodovibrio sodomensis]